MVRLDQVYISLVFLAASIASKKAMARETNRFFEDHRDRLMAICEKCE